MFIKTGIRGPSSRCFFTRQEPFVHFSESRRDSTIALRMEILSHSAVTWFKNCSYSSPAIIYLLSYRPRPYHSYSPIDLGLIIATLLCPAPRAHEPPFKTPLILLIILTCDMIQDLYVILHMYCTGVSDIAHVFVWHVYACHTSTRAISKHTCHITCVWCGTYMYWT